MWQSWLNARDSKSRIRATVSGVRTPPSPPLVFVIARGTRTIKKSECHAVALAFNEDNLFSLIVMFSILSACEGGWINKSTAPPVQQ